MSDQTDTADTGDNQDTSVESEQTEPVDTATVTLDSGADSTTVEIELPVENDELSAVEALEDIFGTVTMRAASDSDTTREAATLGLSSLTDTQFTALRAAYHDGYFERPRERSATEIADSLGVSHSTFLRRLRAAQETVFGEQFE